MDKAIFSDYRIRRIFCLVFCGFFPVLFYGLNCPADDFGTPATGGATEFDYLSVPISAEQIRSPTVPASSYNPGAGLSPGGGYNSSSGGIRNSQGFMSYINSDAYIRNFESTSLTSFTRYSSSTGQAFYSQTPAVPLSNLYGIGASDKIRTGSSGGQYNYPAVSTLYSSAENTPISRYNQTATVGQNMSGLLGRVSGYKGPEQFINIQSASQVPVLSTGDQSVESIISPLNTADRNKTTGQKTSDILQQVNTQIDQFNQQSGQQVSKEAADKKLKDAVAEQWKKKLEEMDSEAALLANQMKAGGGAGAKPKTSSAKKIMSRTPGEEKLFEDKYNQYLITAGGLLKQGEFYKAADAFTWASLYKPVEPAGYVGKSIALFAAGEYVTASRLVAAGLKLSPDYAKTNLDIADMLGDKEKLETRIADLEKYSKTSGAGELYYLLAFVQYKTGQSQKAADSIDIAENKLPADDIVKALKTIISASQTTDKIQPAVK
jgi:hypothetical protein